MEPHTCQFVWDLHQNIMSTPPPDSGQKMQFFTWLNFFSNTHAFGKWKWTYTEAKIENLWISKYCKVNAKCSRCVLPEYACAAVRETKGWPLVKLLLLYYPLLWCPTFLYYMGWLWQGVYGMHLDPFSHSLWNNADFWLEIHETLQHNFLTVFYYSSRLYTA